ncbi:MAG: MATE family efflux transporter [Alphaproteobacteria bacterium]|nr:MATE family efflux transporter [Alphaproteobacteria bacterium]MBU2085013.1 MATE family efflux transporter [Alphaproteobacteria bacterium]MBU2143909.1 MATE family efflux transporter [Alphaproteobacteria bacterium]MBU2198024.1 MATE family efflux transporter [Alphaproteobacteria bacterium]
MLTRRKVFSLAVPIVLAQAATATTGIADTFAMGRFGDKADLAAVAIAAVAYSFIYWGFGFLRMSTTGLSAQANGRGDGPEVRATLLRALILGAAIGAALFLMSPMLRWLAFAAFAGTEHVETLAAGYFNARIFGAPAYLMGLGITGWLIGTGKTGQMLAVQIVMNSVNVVLDIWFVAGLHLGPTGIGAGTAIAEWTALAVGLILVRGGFRAPARLLDKARLAALFSANRDIMIRTLALVFSFGWFVRSGTLIGTAATAGNEVLLQFITVSAFVLDGFAFVAEKEAGEAYGAGNGPRLGRAMRLTSEFAFGFGALFALSYWLGGGWMIHTFIADAEARQAALDFLPFCAAVPLLGVAAWQLDGLFLGTTQGRALRTAGLISAALYIATDITLRPVWGNTGVWTAFLLMYVYRAAALGWFVPSLFRGLSRQPVPAG